MSHRYYDKANRCCSQCKMLCDPQSYDTHSVSECFMIEMKNIKLQKEIKNYQPKEEV